MFVLFQLFLLSSLIQLLLAQNPCAVISDIYLNSSDLQPTVSAELAFQCLNDVDFDASAAEPWLDSLEPYIEWQSTTAYLKDPPAGYLMPAVDIWETLSEIRNKTKFSNGFKTEYEFGLAIYRLFQSTHDGHFRYIPAIVGSVFAFGRPVSLISYSVDGIQTPKVYVYNDVLSNLVNGTMTSFSAVLEINGQRASEYLEGWALHGALQDPDALYNNVFFNLASASLGSSGVGPGTFAGAGRGAYVYPGANTTFTFENGTTTVFDNVAQVLAPFGNIKSGADLYKHWINPSDYVTVDLQEDVKRSLKRSLTPEAPAGYPTPVSLSFDNSIGGYYLDQPGYEDVAVLGVAAFVGAEDYQNVAYTFLQKAKEAGKKKLIIDLSSNGGGTILQGYNLFLNLFPGILPYGATRFRNHRAFNIIGETVSERMFYYPFDYDDAPNYIWGDFIGVPFNYRSDVSVDYQNFASWSEKNPGSIEFFGDKFSSIIRWNLSDPMIYDITGIWTNGFGNRTGLPPFRPFEPENIVLLYDGYCASTCAIFSELMTRQVGNIKTVSVGGRPNNGSMQTVGGTKGTNNWNWASIRNMVKSMWIMAPDQAGFFNSSSLYAYQDEKTSKLPYLRGAGYTASINVRDGIRYGDKTQTPLQFVYEAADCRLYYTAEMTVDVASMWEKVADVAWDHSKCAVGGFGSKPSSLGQGSLASRVARRAHNKVLYRHKRLSALQVAAIEKSLGVLRNNLKPEPGLMLP